MRSCNGADGANLQGFVLARRSGSVRCPAASSRQPIYSARETMMPAAPRNAGSNVASNRTLTGLPTLTRSLATLLLRTRPIPSPAEVRFHPLLTRMLPAPSARMRRAGARRVRVITTTKMDGAWRLPRGAHSLVAGNPERGPGLPTMSAVRRHNKESTLEKSQTKSQLDPTPDRVEQRQATEQQFRAHQATSNRISGFTDTEEVTGSIPVPPTQVRTGQPLQRPAWHPYSQ